MQIPYMAIYVNDKGELVMSHVMRSDGDPLDVERPLKELSDRGLEEASKGIGRVVLATMANWYPQELDKYPALIIPYDEEGDMILITSLISKSIRDKTRVHFASIDALIAEVVREKPELASKSSTIAGWAHVRSMIEKRSV